MGRYQLRSQAIQNNRTATLRSPSVTITASNIIYFACAVSSEAGGDYIAFRIVKYSQPEPSFTNFASGITAIDPYVTYPANHPAVIAVGASTEFDYRSDFSQYGEDLDIVTPGGGGLTWIMTTDRTGSAGETNSDYNDDFGGTSASAPITSGAMALLLSRHPDLNAQQARTLLRKTAKKIGGVLYNEPGETECGGFNQFYGYGRLDVGRMLWLARVAFVAGHGGSVSKPVNAGPFYYDSGAVLEASAVTNVYYKFDQWVSAPAAAATIYHPFMTNSLIAVYDDTTITANFDQLLAAMGTPLEWLAYYGLTSPSFDEAEARDDDSDGHNAFQEWQAGTNPTDGGSVLRITNWERLPDERYVINWQTVSNRVYNLIAYDNPSATNGTTIASGILPTPPMNVFTTAPLSTATRFIHASTSFQ
jgi:hypothetical protein